MKVTYILGGVQMISEGTADELLRFTRELWIQSNIQVETNAIKYIPEWCSGADFSKIPSDWKDVWIVQDSDGTLVAFEVRPLPSPKGNPWWQGEGNYEHLCYGSSGRMLPGWQTHIFKYR